MTCWIILLVAGSTARAQRADLTFADFESPTYAPWETAGTAFGPGPAPGTLPGQMPVSGFRGRQLANSYHGSDRSTGTLTSPAFRVERRYIALLVGGGSFEGKTCVNLLVDDRVVRTATGTNRAPGGTEALQPASWDVGEFAGRPARLQVVDRSTGGWGHITVDHIVFSDRKPDGLMVKASRVIPARDRYLHLPVKDGAPKRTVTVLVNGRAERTFDIELAEDRPDWWTYLDISAWQDLPLVVEADRVPEDSHALASLKQSSAVPDEDQLYRESLRPQLHFSARRGWLNDPNGLVFHDGEYHLFFQHNPYGWNWGNMHWGHAVSSDLVHWEEQGEALYPDALGPMFSGSGVVDWENTSGLGKRGAPPLLLFYTAAGNPTVQCLASSTDGGGSFLKYEGNPIVAQITPGNRDPKVFWHAPSRRWVMALYVEQKGEGPPGAPPAPRQTIQLLTSADARHWTAEGVMDGFFECPDLFALPVDGDPAKMVWVLTAASSEYVLGAFDGKRFAPMTSKLTGHRGRGFYAAQTYSDIPAGDGRRLQIGWLRAPSPGMPFNQCMSLPLQLSLRTTADGPRLAWEPVKELEALRTRSYRAGPVILRPGQDSPLDPVRGEFLELRAEFEPSPSARVRFDFRGVPVAYDAEHHEIEVNGRRAAAPLRDGKMRIALFIDRTALEVFASDGLTYVPMPVLPDPGRLTVSVRCEDGDAHFRTLEVHTLSSIWDRGPEAGR
jgi:sucrose-6-phosphate hydrolase SacC (GH32 family)